MTLLCNYLCDMGIFFDEISVSLDCCITELWHPINTNYVFNRLGDLSLSRNCVVRVTDRFDMTIAVYRGRTAAKEHQQIFP